MEYLGSSKTVNQLTPLVSVCVQTYRHAKFITECLDGVLMQQTDFPFEVVIGEDESTDGTREICQEYAEKHPDKIRLFLRSRKDVIYIDGRPTGRYNLVENLKTSRGKYIALCEGDDYWTDPYKLQKQVDFLEANAEYVVTFHDCSIINGKGELLAPSKLGNLIKEVLLPEDIVAGTLMPTLSVMFRNGLIKTYPKEFFTVLNGDNFLFALLGQFGKGKFLAEVQPAKYRIHHHGMWSTINRLSRELYRLHTFKTIKKVIDPDFYPTVEKTIRLTCLKIAFLYYLNKEYVNFFKFYCKSLKTIFSSREGTRKFLRLNKRFLLNKF